MKKIIFAFSILALILASACKEKKQALENPVVQIRAIRFDPNPPVAGQDLRLVIDYLSPEKTEINFSYRWYVNEKLAQEGKHILSGNKISAGAEIYAEFKASDGTRQTDWMKTEKVKAQSPSLRITRLDISPESPASDQTLIAVIECEECEGIRIHYRWRVNNNLLEGQEERELNGSEAGLKPGDEVVVEISPEPDYPDRWYASLPVKIINRPPEFRDEGKIWLEDHQLYFQVNAFDPDGERLNYQLLEAPSGAQIDQQGRVRWTVPKEFQGEAKFRVQIKDPHGASNEISGSLELSEKELGE